MIRIMLTLVPPHVPALFRKWPKLWRILNAWELKLIFIGNLHCKDSWVHV